MSRSGIVNVRMVITEEKILSNIEKSAKTNKSKQQKANSATRGRYLF